VNQQLNTIKDTDKNKVRLNAAKAGLEKALTLGYTGGQTCQIDPQATVVIEAPKSNFPQCSSYTNPYINTSIVTYDTHGLSATGFNLPEDNRSLNIQICGEPGCYGLMIPSIAVGVVTRLQLGTEGINGGENIDSPDDIKSTDDPNKVVSTLEEQIVELQAAQNAAAVGQKIIPINMDNYQSNQGIKIHEKVHVSQFKELILSVVNKLKNLPDFPHCVHLEGSDKTIQASFDDKISFYEGLYLTMLYEAEDKIIGVCEVPAYNAEKKFLVGLVAQIKNKYHLN
jgi:hypothetical protein